MFLSVYLGPRVDDTEADFSKWGRMFPFFTQSGIGFSYPAVSYLIALEVCFSSYC